MLRMMIAAALCAAAGVANAGSIESFKATTSTRTSIVEVGCPSCAREAARKAAEETEIRLAPGEQIVEVRNVGGEMMIYRTENWLGGSPITMVSKATELDLIALGVRAPEDKLIADTDKAADDLAQPPVTAQTASEPPLFEPVIANTAPAIDKDTKTSALGAAPIAPLDTSKFELRLN
ncbi:MAG: plant virulence effector HPE1-like domain-containing protein [Hoeflea sp.]|uniref:plant virulence effector HPE1-like domain-containing protein n=1 Tax=Hoeflea sp. TaxID=1940281 RepID=UPI00272F7540|nr:plant virulence effector HPE1-like domain-containing protein [Hoeflea sp.]MDP2119779.1 plant virulence effector HPE1-like domain-containing protein [Hoeflea sp.]